MTSELTREIILNYIKKRDGNANETDVIKYIQLSTEVDEVDRSSRITTRKIIDDLEKDNEIRIVKHKRRGQSDRLEFNSEDQTNIVNQIISEIENLIQTMEKPTRNYLLGQNLGFMEQTFEFFTGYQIQVNQMLKVLLMLTTEFIGTRKNTQPLYSRIVKLMVALERQFWHPKDIGRWTIFKYFDDEKEPNPELVSFGINYKLYQNHVTVFKNFMNSTNQFLNSKPT